MMDIGHNKTALEQISSPSFFFFNGCGRSPGPVSRYPQQYWANSDDDDFVHFPIVFLDAPSHL